MASSLFDGVNDRVNALTVSTLLRVKPSKDGGTEPRGYSGIPPRQPSRQRIRLQHIGDAAALVFQ